MRHIYKTSTQLLWSWLRGISHHPHAASGALGATQSQLQCRPELSSRVGAHVCTAAWHKELSLLPGVRVPLQPTSCIPSSVWEHDRSAAGC